MPPLEKQQARFRRVRESRYLTVRGKLARQTRSRYRRCHASHDGSKFSGTALNREEINTSF